MYLEIWPASDADYQIVRKLARFYIRGMAKHAGLERAVDQLSESEDLFANYWGQSRGTRAWPSSWSGFPFLIRVDGHPTGFALVKRLSDRPATFDMGEFFVAQRNRRKGVGRRVTTWLFDTLVGQWEVRELPANAEAQHFWRRIIAEYTGGVFSEQRESFAAYDGRDFIVQRFQTRASLARRQSP